MKILALHQNTIDDLMQAHDLSAMPIGALRRTMRTGWLDPKYPVAFAILVEDRAVGWIQTIPARRKWRGSMVTVCNLSGWYTLPEFRHFSMYLMTAVRKHFKNVPVTVFTASGVAARIYDALKVTHLDATRWALPLSRSETPTDVSISRLADADHPALTSDQKTLVGDHLPHGLNAYMLSHTDGRDLLVMLNPRERKEVAVADVLFMAGAAELLLMPALFTPDLGLGGSETLLIDTRHLPAVLKEHVSELRPVTPRYILHDPDQNFADLDFLYSEIFLNTQNLL